MATVPVLLSAASGHAEAGRILIALAFVLVLVLVLALGGSGMGRMG